jgi:phospholipase C
MASILDEVKTIILVMMENRSFDHMLGHLTLENPALPIEGLKAESVADGSYSNHYKDTPYPPYPLVVDVELEADVPHEWNFVATQMHWDAAATKFAMDGFVQAYADAGNIPKQPCIPMAYFPSNLVPITTFLAKNFCVCDHWFSPIPTSTQPNRTMALCGDTAIFDTHTQLIPIGANMFDWMETNNIRWKVYHDGFSFFALYDKLWRYVLGDNFSRFTNFYADQLLAPADDDPQVIIIEPCYEDAPHFGSQHPNDNHAPLAVGFGEDFLRQVYLAATANPQRWASTVMVLYYDEHGGFYDHVAPPAMPYTTTGDPSHAFTSLGPRIPGIIVSPFVAPGSIFSGVLDHTAVLQFLADKFTQGKPLCPNVTLRQSKGIHSLTEALSAQPPRPIVNIPPQPLSVQTSLGKYLPMAAPGNMELSFTNAADQLMQQQQPLAVKKYPELVAWKDLRTKNAAAHTG